MKEKLKQRIVKWLDIKIPGAIEPKMDDYEKRFTKLEDRFNFFMAEYHPSLCSRCGISMLAHYGGFYRTAEGLCLCKSCANPSATLEVTKKIK